MARTIGKLTALAADKAKRRGYYGDGGGLFLQVSASGSKSWVFRFKDAGKLREMGLGPTTPSGSLRRARRRGNVVACASTALIPSRLGRSLALRRDSTQPRR